MSRMFKTRCLVLRRRPLGEKDEIVSFLSPRLGIFDAAAGGSRRMSSPLIGKVEPFTELDCLFADGRSLPHLVQASVVNSHSGLLADYSKVCSAAYLCGLASRISCEGASSGPIYSLIAEALAIIERSRDFQGVLFWCEMRALVLSGSYPELDSCVSCRSKDISAYSPAAGGCLCPRCAGLERDAASLAPRELAALRWLRRVRISAASSLRADRELSSGVSGFLRAHLQYYWPGAARSEKLLAI